MNRHIFRGSKTNRDRRDQAFARSVIAIAERRRLDENLVQNALDAFKGIGEALADAEQAAREDQPIGECPHCGSEFYDEGEMKWHHDAGCVGGMERFR